MIPSFRYRRLSVVVGISLFLLSDLSILMAADTSKPVPGKPAAAKASPAKPSGVKPVPAPIPIEPVHPGDTTVSGTAIFINVPVSAVINGVPGIGSMNPDSKTGKFVIPLASPAQIGNYIVVSGVAADGTKTSGSTTVVAAGATAAATPAPPAAPVSLSAPTISAVHDGDKTIKVIRSAADSQPGLTIHIDVGGNPLVWSGDCAPDATLSCTVTPNPPLLTSGETIQAYEVLTANGSPTKGKPAQAEVTAAAGLAAPNVSASEGSPVVFVTPDKGDAGRPGLRIVVAIVDSQSQPVGPTSAPLGGSCAPDTAGDKCQINLAKPINGIWKVKANEMIGAQQGPTVIADPTAVKALGKPTISPPHQGDKTVTVTLNPADVSAAAAPVQIAIDVKVKDVHHDCLPTDSSNQCVVKLNGKHGPSSDMQLLDGDRIVAQEKIVGDDLRPIDAEAVATAVSDSLGIPTVAKIREGDTSAYLKLNQNDFLKWPGKLSLSAAVFDATDPVPGQSQTCSPSDATKDFCTITLLTLAQGQTLHVKEIPAPSAAGTPSIPGPESIVDVQELGYNWGRVRAYFSTGAVLSRSNISTSNATSQPMVVASNFGSPDAFVGLDMDANWYSSQGCLASAYVSRSVQLTTLANAVEQCNASLKNPEISDDFSPGLDDTGGIGDSADPAANRYFNADQARLKSLNGVLRKTTDRDSARVLGFLVRVYKSQSLRDKKNQNPRQPIAPVRVDALIVDLQGCDALGAENNGAPVNGVRESGETKETPDECRRLKIAELVSLDLTPYEARQLLTSTGFELKNGGGFLVNTYFQAKLTQTAASNGIALASSPNSFHVETGVYTPFYFNWTRWTYAHQPYAMFFAPIAKLGFDSLRGSATDQITLATGTASTAGDVNFQNAAQALSKDVYRGMAIGGRIGFFRLAPVPTRAPELISYIDFTYGRYDNFFVEKYGSTTGAVGFPGRLDIIGALNIPATPMYIGTELNKGPGPDAMSIFIGLRTDLSSTLGKLIPTVK